MTAIAGCAFDNNRERREQTCAEILRGLPSFESSRRASLQHASFAASIRRKVPEDAYDRQPLEFESRFLVAADLRLDNRSELAAQLGIDTSARQLSDIDLLLLAWAHWGETALDRLNGDYALAVYDAFANALYLARDPAGQRPLFYSRDDGAVRFATLPSGLLLGSGPCSFNARWIAKKLHGFADISEATVFSGVSRVLPGELVRLTPDGVSRRRYWCPPTKELDLTLDEFAEQYTDVLESAVQSRLRRTRSPIAAHLSAGFDSSAITAAAALSADPDDLIAFTGAPRAGFDGVVPPGRIADESALAEATARMYGIQHRIVRPSGQLLTHLRRQSRQYQEPDRNIINMDWWSGILAAANAAGADVLLTGTMGNLTLNWGGMAALPEWWRKRGILPWLREAGAARTGLGVTWRACLMATFGHHIPIPGQQALHQLYRKEPPAKATSFVPDHWVGNAREFAAEYQSDFERGEPSQDRLAILIAQERGVFTTGGLIEAGVEERDPMTDRRVLEFGFRLPPEQLLSGGVARPLMRRALEGRVPPAVLENRLRGLQGADWYENIHRQELDELIEETSANSTVSDLIDFDKLRSTVRAWPVSGWDSAYVTSVYRRAVTLAISTAVFIDEYDKLTRSQPVDRMFA